MGRTENGDAKKRTTRGRGEGSVWKEEKTGRWWYAISINGKQQKYRASTKSAALARLKELRTEHEHGVTPGRKHRLKDHCQECMDKVFSTLKPKTQRAYRQAIEHYLLPYLGENTLLKHVEPEMILDMFTRMRAAGLAENTVGSPYRVGKRVFKLALRWRRVLFNPFDLVDPPASAAEAEKIPLTLTELQALRAAVAGHRLAVLYELAWALGLRLGELLGIPLANIDLDAGTLTISQQVLDIDGSTQIVPYTKNNRVRVLPLTPRLSGLVRGRMAQLFHERTRDDWEEHGLLFPSERGTPMSESNFNRHLDGRCVAAQIRLRTTGKRTKRGKPILKSAFHPHLFRHTALTWLGESGAKKLVIKAIAGHADKDVTDRYLHTSQPAMREALECMERAYLLPDEPPSELARERAKVG